MANNHEYIIDKKIVNNGMSKTFFNLNYITIVKTYFPVLKSQTVIAGWIVEYLSINSFKLFSRTVNLSVL